MFIGLLSFSGSLLTKFMSLNNEQCEARPALTDLDPAEFNYYLLMIWSGKFNQICNILTSISGRIYDPNKTEDVNLSDFNLITRINELQTLTKHESCKWKCKFDGSKCNSNQNWNNDKCPCEWKNSKKMCARRVIFSIMLHAVVKMVDIEKALMMIH